MTTPAAMTFDSLVTDIQVYANVTSTEFSDQIPRFIMLAENRIASEARGLGLLKIVSATMSAGNPEIAKPSRWRETSSIRITVGTSQTAIYERSYEYCRYYAPDSAVTGTPRYYSDYGYEHFLIVPSPALAYPFELMYFERPEPLSTLNQSNWTTQYAPQLILYASLLEAQPYLKDSSQIEVYKGFYAQALSALMTEAKRRSFDRSAAVRE